MSLDIYFWCGSGVQIEVESYLNITHNLNKLVDECGKIAGKPYYKVIWRPEELIECNGGEVPVDFILQYLPSLIKDLSDNEEELKQYLPENGWGTFDGLMSFLGLYLKECYENRNAYVYCCR